MSWHPRSPPLNIVAGQTFELPNAFWSKVQKTQECWLWTAAKTGFGYGTITFDNKQYNSHRLCLMSTGVDLRGLHTRHICKNPSCVNPSHLIAGTARDNRLDRIKHGTHGRLSEAQVIEIRQKYSEIPVYPGGKRLTGSVARLAAEYQITCGNLVSIVTRKSWKHI